MSKTVHVTSPAQFSQIVSSSNIVVVDFYADWCGPCKTIAPMYEQLSSQLSRPNKITFTKVNTDHQQEIARSFNISAMPTFLILKSSREIKRIQGANPTALTSAVQALAREAESVDSSSGAGPSTSGGTWMGSGLPRGYGDVTDQVDVRSLDLLNRDTSFGTGRTLFETSEPTAKGKDWVESDTDDQLMLFVPFMSTLKVHSLHVTSHAPLEGNDVMRPAKLKIYQNTTHNLSFDEAEDTQAVQEIELKKGDWDEKTKTAKVELRFVKFQKCSSLVLLVEKGLGGGEKTRVDRLRIIGEAGEKKSMGKLEKVGEES